MFTTLLAISAVALAPLADLKCPVMGGPAILHTNTVEYAGATFGFCCPGCDTRFAQNPDRLIQAQARRGSVVGLHLFDPVSGRRITPEKAEFSRDHQGIRYLFASQQNLDTFVKDIGKFTRAPRRESLECPVMRKSVSHISLAGGYVDHQGVRYYVCCPGCLKPLAENPAKHLEKPVRTRNTAAVPGKPVSVESALVPILATVAPTLARDKGKCDCTSCGCECGCDARACKCTSTDCGCDCGCAKTAERVAGSCACTDCKSEACTCECASKGTPCTCQTCKPEDQTCEGKGGKCC